MSAIKNIEVRVKAEGKSMTLAEVREFMAAMDRAGATEDSVIAAHINFGGTLRELRSDIKRFGV